MSAPTCALGTQRYNRTMKTNTFETGRIYTAKCTKAWDGDAFGNSWTCGASVYVSEELGPRFGDTFKLFRVFEDDGEGNGDHLDSFDDEAAAREYAELYVRFLDAGGYGDSPEYAAMARHSLKNSHYSLAEASQ